MITFAGKKSEIETLLSKINCELRRPSGGIIKHKYEIFDLNNCVSIGNYSELTGSGELKAFELLE